MPERIDPGPNQESVWDYPRPPAVDPVDGRIRVVFNHEPIADTTSALRVLETSHPPVYYLPPQDVKMAHLHPTGHSTWCEFKGRAEYFTLTVDSESAENAAWAYPDPTEKYDVLKDHVAFYPSKMDACYVGDERAEAQEGDFYGGWITSRVVGPFKGPPGSEGW